MRITRGSLASAGTRRIDFDENGVQTACTRPAARAFVERACARQEGILLRSGAQFGLRRVGALDQRARAESADRRTIPLLPDSAEQAAVKDTAGHAAG